MNPMNYASLEASKRLHEAGIVLETEAFYAETDNIYGNGYEFVLCSKPGGFRNIPAPSMAEVWRELPPQGCYFTANQGYYYAWMEWADFDGHGNSCEAKENTNPTDALIGLLIWVRRKP